MFWRSKKTGSGRQVSTVYSDAIKHFSDELSRAINDSRDFNQHISDPQIIRLMEQTYEDTKSAASDLGAAHVFTSVIMQLRDLIHEKRRAGHVEQVAWGLNVARDIIFGYAPAIAFATRKNVDQVTRKFFGELIHVSTATSSKKINENTTLRILETIHRMA